MEFSDFNGFVLKKPCPKCYSELVYTYDDKDETQHYHVAECSKKDCAFIGMFRDEDAFNSIFGGFRDSVDVDRLALDVQQLQETVETLKCCMNCFCFKDICLTKKTTEWHVCSLWKSLSEGVAS